MTAMAHLSLTLAVVFGLTTLAILYLAGRDWCRFRDERAARSVLVALILVAAAVGSIASAYGLFLMVTQRTAPNDPVVFAGAVARMAMVTGGVAYIVGFVRRRKR